MYCTGLCVSFTRDTHTEQSIHLYTCSAVLNLHHLQWATYFHAWKSLNSFKYWCLLIYHNVSVFIYTHLHRWHEHCCVCDCVSIFVHLCVCLFALSLQSVCSNTVQTDSISLSGLNLNAQVWALKASISAQCEGETVHTSGVGVQLSDRSWSEAECLMCKARILTLRWAVLGIHKHRSLLM